MKAVEDTMISFLNKFDRYPFLVKMNGKEYLIGDGKTAFTINLKREIPVQELLTSTSIALGEAYMKGDIEVEGDLYQALNCFLGQMGKFQTDTKALKKLIFSSLSKKNQEKEVSSHYDIGNEFYKLWLDKTMSYSCGYFKTENDSLELAQQQKIERILQKLYLQEGMTLLDIGCGWGELLIQAARKYKVHGTGITLSREQYKQFSERIEKEELTDYLVVKLMDYRDLKTSELAFDRVVSVGMLEHVGRENYDLFMENVAAVLKSQGLLLLQYISALKEYPGDAWIKKYIFPGGVIPSLREIEFILAEHCFYTLDVESLRRHYNLTLLHWDKNFQAHRDEIEETMGTEFTKMWDLYLCACAATFQNGIIDLHQILVSKGVHNELPMTRWY
ncbi:MAG: cyclopropane-fatty-acyl-phospholipid synthase [Lachnospiraceae bacterium]|nr:cyclopropane-fatty-acyl-phospholipid synthase [Lachnospiraceae bacterium]